MKWNEEKLRQAFVNMEKEGWNTTTPLKWGFSFMDSDKNKLLDVFNELKEYGYDIELLDFKDNLNLWLLYIVKTEILTIDKLNRRNLSFEELANYYEVECYDGWDAQRN